MASSRRERDWGPESVPSRIAIPPELADAIDAVKAALDIHMKDEYSFSVMKLDDQHSGTLVAAVGPFGGTVAPTRKDNRK